MAKVAIAQPSIESSKSLVRGEMTSIWQVIKLTPPCLCFSSTSSNFCLGIVFYGLFYWWFSVKLFLMWGRLSWMVKQKCICCLCSQTRYLVSVQTRLFLYFRLCNSLDEIVKGTLVVVVSGLGFLYRVLDRCMWLGRKETILIWNWFGWRFWSVALLLCCSLQYSSIFFDIFIAQSAEIFISNSGEIEACENYTWSLRE